MESHENSCRCAAPRKFEVKGNLFQQRRESSDTWELWLYAVFGKPTHDMRYIPQIFDRQEQL